MLSYQVQLSVPDCRCVWRDWLTDWRAAVIAKQAHVCLQVNVISGVQKYLIKIKDDLNKHLQPTASFCLQYKQYRICPNFEFGPWDIYCIFTALCNPNIKCSFTIHVLGGNDHRAGTYKLDLQWWGNWFILTYEQCGVTEQGVVFWSWYLSSVA